MTMLAHIDTGLGEDFVMDDCFAAAGSQTCTTGRRELSLRQVDGPDGEENANAKRWKPSAKAKAKRRNQDDK